MDDLFLTSAEKFIAEYKANMVVEFEMKDVSVMHYFLGLKEGLVKTRGDFPSAR